MIFAPPLDRVFDLLFDFLPLFLGMQRPHQHAGLETVADADLLRLFDELFHKRVRDAVEKIQTLDRQTGLAAIEKAAHRGGAHGALDIGVVANDHRIAAAQFQRHMLEIFGGGLHDATAGIRGAGEADLSDRGIDQQLFADHAAGTGNDIQNAFRAAGILDRFLDDLAGAQIG